MLDATTLDFAKGGGVVTVVAQDAVTGRVLMVAHADREAIERTLQTGEMHYFSRRRGLWRKGATSGNTQRVASIAADCDGDAVLARVVPNGPACHTGAGTCFGDESSSGVLSAIDAIIATRSRDESMEGDAAGPGRGRTERDGAAAGDGARGIAGSYTVALLRDRNRRLKKLGEEVAELIVACATDDRAGATRELADLIYHALVALRALGGSLGDVERVLAERRKR